MKKYIGRVVKNKASRVAGFSVLFGVAAAVNATTRGPIECSGCNLSSSTGDRTVSDAIEGYQSGPGYVDAVGDIYIVCNTSLCGYYAVSSDFRYSRVKLTTRDGQPVGGGSGGGGAGTGGGWKPPGGGDDGGGEGTVIVGEVEKKD